MYAHIHALHLNKLESQRTAGSKTPGAEAQRPRAALNYYYVNDAVGPTRHQGHRRTRGEIRRDTKGTGGHTGDPRDTKRTGEHSGGVERDTKRTGEHNRGIGAGRKTTRTQQTGQKN
jgi:hypothetical protein